MRVSTGLLMTLGAITSGLGTGAFLTLALLGERHVFWTLVALVLSAMGYWFLAHSYFIRADQIQRALVEYDASYEEGHYSVRDVLREEL